MNKPAAAMAQRREDQVYFHMALACAAVAFLGFAPTYLVPLLKGTLQAQPIMHIHALVFFGWSLLLVYQTWLATTRRIVRHRSMGLLAISIATTMTITGILIAIHRMHMGEAAGFGEAARTFAIVPLGAICFFAVVFALAVANVKRADWHKRLMILAAVSILNAAIARWFIVFLAPPAPAGPPPVAVDFAPSLVALLMLAYPMISDWKTIGRPHPVYVWGAIAYAASKVLALLLSGTALWQGVAMVIQGLAS